MDFRHFEREACYYYLTNFHQRQESGCYSEVNRFAFCEVTTKSVSRKLCCNTALRCRQREEQHESVSVVLSDESSVEELKTSDSMKPRRKPALRCRQQEHEKVSENIYEGLSDADSSQSDGVEDMKTSVSMKLRNRTSLRGRQKQQEHENISVVLSDADSSQSDGVEEMKKSDSMILRRKPALRCRQQEQVCDNVTSVVLSDTDSSQSDGVEDINVSVIHDMKRPIKRRRRSGPSCQLSEVDERPLSIVEPQYGRVSKISLTPGAMAEDTLGKLRLMPNNSGSELWPRSTDESRRESLLDESSTDLMVKSGPSSPCHPVDGIRCKECESLFVKMRRQLTPKKKSRDRNPESLSCDEWILLKKWHPQRRCHRKKGLLWTSLSHIRKLSAQGSGSASINTTQVNCSRPHVFQRRSLRRCKYLTSIQTDLSVTKAKPRDRKRPRAVAWPPVGGWKHSVKRKSSVNDTFSKQLSPLDLRVCVRQEDKLLVNDQIARLNADHRQNSDASSKQRRTNVRVKLNKQEVPDGVDGTRRVLKFDDTPETVAVETAVQRKSPRRQRKRGEIREAQNGFQSEQQEELSEDLDGFRTPTDLFSAKPKIKQGYQKKVSATGNTKPAAQKPNFKSMLIDTLVKSQNQIIKESSK